MAINQLFSLGRIVCTASVHRHLSENPEFAEFVHASITAHVSGDWGDIDPEDAGLNEQAILDGTRILSVYTVGDNSAPTAKIWIITEADRSSTCILWPHEY